MKQENDEKRERVLKAGLECFTLYGLKRTTMEDIAQKAGVSRGALYLLFSNKEAIFQALSEQLHLAAVERAEAALMEAGPLEQRLVAAFEGRFLELIEIVLNSPHGYELSEVSQKLDAPFLEKIQTRFKATITKALQEAEKSGEISLERVKLDPEHYGELMITAVSGLKMSAKKFETYRKQLGQLVGVFCGAIT